jgi:hypothetical protein
MVAARQGESESSFVIHSLFPWPITKRIFAGHDSPTDRSLITAVGCAAMIYPSAFNTTTGPMHWTLLQRAR